MIQETGTSAIKRIPIKDIHILNPRIRNKKTFDEITDNIAQVGLKRPITVTPYSWASDKPYALVCGQGRLEAFLACGQSKIPALIIDVNEEEALTMGLIENLARRQHTSIDLFKGIGLLLDKKYTPKLIAQKTGLSIEYVKPIVKLIKLGEERLLSAVDAGHLPLDIALQISASPGEEQQALQDAYENNKLRGRRFLIARKLIETRRNKGKALRNSSGEPLRKRPSKKLSGRDILRIYQQEAERKRSLINKSEFVNNQLIFVVEALRQLYRDDTFKGLLMTEKLTTLPTPLSEILDKRAKADD
jgi:ParB family chromosome partitioning protein